MSASKFESGAEIQKLYEQKGVASNRIIPGYFNRVGQAQGLRPYPAVRLDLCFKRVTVNLYTPKVLNQSNKMKAANFVQRAL